MSSGGAAPIAWEEAARLIHEAKADPQVNRQQIAAIISKMAAKADDETLIKLSTESELFLHWLSTVRTPSLTPHYRSLHRLAAALPPSP